MNTVIKNGENIDFSVDSGSTWKISMNWTNNDGTLIDLGGYIGRMYLKRNYDKPIAFEITTTNGRMTVGMGLINWTVTDEDTANLSGSYLYDIEMQSFNGEVTRLFQGQVVFNPEVTR